METLLMMLFVGALAKGAQQRLCLVAVREERREPTGTILAMARRLGCMIIRNSQVLSKNGNE